MPLKRRTVSPSAYADAVVTALTAEFPDLADNTTAQIVRSAVAKHVAAPAATFEVILDSPVTANWRLRADREKPAHVRVACYRVTPTQMDLDREQQLNDRLAELTL